MHQLPMPELYSTWTSKQKEWEIKKMKSVEKLFHCFIPMPCLLMAK